MHIRQAVKSGLVIVCVECFRYIFQHILRWTLVFVLLKTVTELSEGEVVWAGRVHPAECQEAGFRHAECFLRNSFYLETVVSDICNLVIYLVSLPVHYRIELGF